MKTHLNTNAVMRVAESKPDLKLFTLRDRKLFHVRASQAEPTGLRFDRYANQTYDTIKREDVEAGVAAFNRLSPDARLKPSNYAGNHHAASYLAAFLVYCASYKPSALASDETNLPEFSGQGYGLKPNQRKAVEDWGIERASAFYENLGWTVSPRGKPFDLLCTNKTGQTHYVEVKASTGVLDEILVTQGEINFACAHPDQVDLFILESVQLKRNRASGGKHRAFLWKCDRRKAVPTHSRYPLER